MNTTCVVVDCTNPARFAENRCPTHGIGGGAVQVALARPMLGAEANTVVTTSTATAARWVTAGYATSTYP